MGKIKNQIKQLKEEFNTSFISNKCSKTKLSKSEIDKISDIFETIKYDGNFNISLDIDLQLKNGRATILNSCYGKK